MSKEKKNVTLISKLNGGESETHKGMAFTGLEGKLLVVHGLCVKLREGIGSAAEGGVHASIHLVEAGGHRLSLLPHRP